MRLKPRFPVVCLAVWGIFFREGSVLAGPEAGVTLGVGDQPKPVSFIAAADRQCYFNYPPRVALWDTPTKNNPITSGQHLTTPPAAGDVNGDADVDLTDFAEFQSCFTGAGGGPIGPGCGPCDEGHDDDVDLDDFAAFRISFTGPLPLLHGDIWSNGKVDLNDYLLLSYCLTQGGPGQLFPGCGYADLDADGDVDLADYADFQTVFGNYRQVPNVRWTVYAEGLASSTTLGDVRIDLYADPEGDQTFTLADSQAATVFGITVSPTTVSLGTPLTATLQPAGGPILFDTATTATWTGNYVPTVGSPMALSITYDADHVLESSSSQAVLIAGAGTSSVPLAAFLSSSTLVGRYTFNLTGLVISAPLNLNVVETAATLYTIDYMTQDLMPVLGSPATSLRVHAGPVPSESEMVLSVMYHYAAVAPVEKNAQTLTGPTTLNIQVMTLNSTFTVVQDQFSLTLTRLPDDTNPNYLLYASDLAKPLFPLNVDVDPAPFTQVIPFQTVDNGIVVVVPEGVQP